MICFNVLQKILDKKVFADDFSTMKAGTQFRFNLQTDVERKATGFPTTNCHRQLVLSKQTVVTPS